ncbi:hypothetical protein ABZ412_34695 [Nocardia sp. NPDC005746]|uniref:hypothetical protein n=1 Tax=Nocardia sp. NPDC005746 TaxID=3157062 RepID=UPI0033C026E2
MTKWQVLQETSFWLDPTQGLRSKVGQELILWPQNPSRVHPGEELVYAGLVILNNGSEPVGRETVRISVPDTVSLHTPVASRWLWDNLAGGGCKGVLSDDRHTWIGEVNLNVSPGGYKLFSTGISVAGDAAPGLVEITVEVGASAFADGLAFVEIAAGAGS